MEDFETSKMKIRREYYDTTGKKPEERLGAYADYLERKLVKKSTTYTGVSNCPACGSNDMYTAKLKHYKCRKCKEQFEHGC